MLLTCWVLAFFFVILITVSALGYGFAVYSCKRFKICSLTTTPILGLGLLTTACMATGVVGLYSSLPQLTLVAMGWGLFLYSREHAHKWWRTYNWNPFHKQHLLWLLFPLLYYLSRVFAAGLPQQHSDPLYYHLLAPKFWSQWGQIRLTAQHPSFVQATLFETLFGLPMMWLDALQPLLRWDYQSKLITSQIAAQWMHMVWGQWGSLLLGIALLQRFLKQPVPWGLQVFTAWLCTTLPSLEWTGVLAKNDYILLLFLLASVFEVYGGTIAAAGLFMGLAYSTKMFAFWTGLSLFVLIPPRQWLRYIGFALLAISPTLIRNIIFTGNPVFPVLDNILGPHWTSQAWKQANETFAGPPHFDTNILVWLWSRGLERTLPKILLVASVFSLLFQWKQIKCFPLKLEIIFTLIQLFLALSILKPLADGRYASPIFIAFLLIVAGSSLHFFKYKAAFLLLPLGLLVRIPVEVMAEVSKYFLFRAPNAYLNSFHVMQPTHLWVAANVKKNEKILFTYDKINYYLDHDFECVTEMKKWEDFFTTLHHPPELFEALRRQGYRYLQFTIDVSGGPTFSKMNQELAAYKKKAVFLTSTSMILDLYQLRGSRSDGAPSQGSFNL